MSDKQFSIGIKISIIIAIILIIAMGIFAGITLGKKGNSSSILDDVPDIDNSVIQAIIEEGENGWVNIEE